MSDPLHTGRSSGEPDDLTCLVEWRNTRRDRLPQHLGRLQGLDALNDLDRVAVRFAQSNLLAAAAPIDGFDTRRAGHREIFLVAHGPGKADELRIVFSVTWILYAGSVPRR